MANKSDASTCVKYFHFRNLLQSRAWTGPVYVGMDGKGIVRYVSPDEPRGADHVEDVPGLAVPGFQNAHSHAFQYAMAGSAETHKPGTNDDFWSWREAMYQCALSMNPDQVQTVATALYIELLKRGYTHVAEFHYLHHDKTGKPYGNPAEISVSLLAAASLAGIKITLVPIFYQKGGFGKDAQPRQKRFIFHSIDQYLMLAEEANSVVKKITTANIGFGVHSLRAASADDIIKIAELTSELAPFHLHAAEQKQEVEDCLSHLNQRPVEWLLDHLPLSDRFNIVHCTHLNEEEVIRLAASKANVVLCPGTEGNLGDGIFRLTEFSRYNGNWCIGTDSHVSLNPLEDLRWLDYGQRLMTHRRNTFVDGGFEMMRRAFFCGSKAMGIDRQEFFEVGKPFDAVVYHANASLFSDGAEAHWLSKILYTTDSRSVLGTIVNGEWIVRNGYHHHEESAAISLSQTLKAIANGK